MAASNTLREGAASGESDGRRSEVRLVDDVNGDEPITARILIVDDYAPNLLALEALLERTGAAVVRAASGEEALKRLLLDDFALIIMDVQMPGLDGLETARMIKERERTRHIPIIFLTAISKDQSHVFRGYEEGAVDYLFKPYDPEILRSKVSVFVELYKRGETIKRQEALLRKREREALERQQERQHRELMDAMPVLVWASDGRGRVTQANESWTRYFGIPSEGATWEDIRSLTHRDDRERLERERAVTLSTQRPFEMEIRLRGQDGEHRWFLMRAVPLVAADGDARRAWICTATDISDRMRIEDELRRANAAKDDFLAAASHELRTPLAAAKAQVQLALRRMRNAPDDGAKRSLGITCGQIDRMGKLVEDLLDVSRIEAGRLSLQIDRLDLAATVRDVCDRMQPLSETHPIRVDAPETLEFQGDRDRLEQVLNNLLSNAIRYSPNGCTIDVVLRSVDGGIELSVRDRGVGIPAEKQSVIFERFGRAHGSRYGGLGLGLTITAGIVQQHGGSICVESTGVEGEGSTFRVRLPA